MILKCFVIDDMPAIIRLIKTFCEETLLTCFTGGESDVKKGLDMLLNGNVEADIIFLDIEMPGVSGLDLIEPLSRVGGVILISGHKDYGEQAFERGAMGYIFKPFDLKKFQDTISRVFDKIRDQNSLKLSSPVPFYYLPLEGRDNRTRLKAEEIVYAEATGNFTVIYMTTGAEHICSLNLTQLSTLLAPPHFIRISRSYTINMAKMISYDANDVYIDNGKVFPFGSKFRPEFIRLIRQSGMLY